MGRISDFIENLRKEWEEVKSAERGNHPYEFKLTMQEQEQLRAVKAEGGAEYVEQSSLNWDEETSEKGLRGYKASVDEKEAGERAKAKAQAKGTPQKGEDQRTDL